MFSNLWAKKTTSKVENENAEIALKDDLDAHGKFTRAIDGTLEFNDFLVFRSAILRQTDRKFLPIKQDLKKKQYDIYLAKNQQAYGAHFIDAQKQYTDCLQYMSKFACDHIDLELKLYQLTYQTILENQELTQQLVQREKEVRETLENETIVANITEEVAVEATKFRIQEELAMFRKLQAFLFTMGEQQRNHFSALEYCKVSNKLQEKFGFDADQLNIASKRYNLEENKTIQMFVKLSKAQKESEQKKEVDRATPSPEKIAELIKRGEELGAVQIKADGCLTFDYLLSTMKLCGEYTFLHTEDGLNQFKAERRAALAKNDQTEYQNVILKASNWEILSSRVIQGNLFQKLNVSPQVFQNSMQIYMSNPQKRQIFDEEMNTLREKLTKNEPQELTREQCLLSQTKLEDMKVDINKKLFDAANVQRLPQPTVEAMAQVEKLKAEDAFFNENGFEVTDIAQNIERLNLSQDKDLLAIFQKYQEIANQFITEKQAEQELLIKQMNELKVQENATTFDSMKELDQALF